MIFTKGNVKGWGGEEGWSCSVGLRCQPAATRQRPQQALTPLKHLTCEMGRPPSGG